MASESVHEQIAQGLKTRLAGIVAGADYWYTPDAVLLAPYFSDTYLKNGKPVTYVLSPDIEEDSPLTFSNMQSVMSLDLTVAKLLSRAGLDDPWTTTDGSRWQLQNRLIRDAKKRLRGDLTVVVSGTALALQVLVPVTERSVEQTWLPAWAVAYMRLEVLYQYADGTP